MQFVQLTVQPSLLLYTHVKYIAGYCMLLLLHFQSQ